jgi:hypothetical protein
MGMHPNRKKLVMVSLVVLEVIATRLAWRDLARRSDDQVRGRKSLWRVFVSLNPGNSLIYWAIGRRR